MKLIDEFGTFSIEVNSHLAYFLSHYFEEFLIFDFTNQVVLQTGRYTDQREILLLLACLCTLSTYNDRF